MLVLCKDVCVCLCKCVWPNFHAHMWWCSYTCAHLWCTNYYICIYCCTLCTCCLLVAIFRDRVVCILVRIVNLRNISVRPSSALVNWPKLCIVYSLWWCVLQKGAISKVGWVCARWWCEMHGGYFMRSSRVFCCVRNGRTQETREDVARGEVVATASLRRASRSRASATCCCKKRVKKTQNTIKKAHMGC